MDKSRSNLNCDSQLSYFRVKISLIQARQRSLVRYEDIVVWQTYETQSDGFLDVYVIQSRGQKSTGFWLACGLNTAFSLAVGSPEIHGITELAGTYNGDHFSRERGEWAVVKICELDTNFLLTPDRITNNRVPLPVM